MRAAWGKLLLALALLAGLLGAAVGALASPAGAASSVLIVYISSLSGPGASQYLNSQAGFLARVAQQNARGGVNGHRIVTRVVDDGTSPANVTTAVQNAIANGAIGIVANSPVFFAAAKYAQQAGLPVTGAYTDGPEWGQQPYTNMFASDRGSVNPKYPVNTLTGKILRAHGGSVIGAYGYGISPSSSSAAIGSAQSFKLAGGSVGVLDTTVPFGGVDFTTEALVAKQKGVNALIPALDDNSNYALATALSQAGAKLKAVLFATGYEPTVINSPVWSTLQGDLFFTQFRPFSLPNAGTANMGAALRRYGGFKAGQFPTFSQYEAWLGADLMIQGLTRAGSSPTPAKVISGIRSITAYNGGGLLPITINYKTVFGKDLPECVWLLKAAKTAFIPLSATPTCGVDVPGTSTLSSSG
jgi:branched-chain amino acid transport system substrate-binding protein